MKTAENRTNADQTKLPTTLETFCWRLSCRIYLIFKGRDKLLVARQYIRTILDEHTQSPKSERRFAILLHNIKMGIIDTPTHLPDLLDHSVDALWEWVIQRAKGCLQILKEVNEKCKETFHDTDLPSAENVVTWKIKHILNKLGDCIASDPQEYSLSVLN